MGNELVPLGLTYQLLQMAEKGEAFLIRDYGIRIVWVFSFQVNDKFGEFVVLSKLVDSVR